jgi:hypothetical protein
MTSPETIIGMAHALCRRDEGRSNPAVMADLLSVDVSAAEEVLQEGLSIAGEWTAEDDGDQARLVLNAMMVGVAIGVAAEACQRGGVGA